MDRWEGWWANTRKPGLAKGGQVCYLSASLSAVSLRVIVKWHKLYYSLTSLTYSRCNPLHAGFRQGFWTSNPADTLRAYFPQRHSGPDLLAERSDGEQTHVTSGSQPICLCLGCSSTHGRAHTRKHNSSWKWDMSLCRQWQTNCTA